MKKNDSVFLLIGFWLAHILSIHRHCTPAHRFQLEWKVQPKQWLQWTRFGLNLIKFDSLLFHAGLIATRDLANHFPFFSTWHIHLLSFLIVANATSQANESGQGISEAVNSVGHDGTHLFEYWSYLHLWCFHFSAHYSLSTRVLHIHHMEAYRICIPFFVYSKNSFIAFSCSVWLV